MKATSYAGLIIPAKLDIGSTFYITSTSYLGRYFFQINFAD
jgi:hypothetical protein